MATKRQRIDRRRVGQLGEDLAAAHLVADGMTVVERNWRCRHGEVDIIAREDRAAGTNDRRIMVFCEVKCRTGLGFGGPLEAITWAKVRKLRQLAGEWVATHDATWRGWRIDAIGVICLPGRPPRLDHVRGIG